MSKDQVWRVFQGMQRVSQEAIKLQLPAVERTVERNAFHIQDMLRRLLSVMDVGKHQPQMDSEAKEMNQTEPYDTEWIKQTDEKENVASVAEIEDPVRKNHTSWLDEVIPSSSEQSAIRFEDFAHKKNDEWIERAVPSTPMARIFGFGSLAAKVLVGTAAEAARTMGQPRDKPAFATEANTAKLVETLCTMRGAALKLGQMMSIQDEAVVPPALAFALERVRQGLLMTTNNDNDNRAHVMPKKQLYAQLAAELGPNWKDRFETFDPTPIAAASIGQVHRAVLKHSGALVALKVQYPGVADSIESDLSNLKRLISYTNLVPKGLYLDEIIRVAQTELAMECDYTNEAANQQKYRQLIQHDAYMSQRFIVPDIHAELSSTRVLTSDLIAGVPIDKTVHLPQNVRNRIALRLLVLTLKELFEWAFMQTDPNWSNFLYNAATDQVGLIDFGAAMTYDRERFVDDYFTLVWSAANDDTDTLMEYSVKLGFLTGDESKAMIDAHRLAAMVVGEPFRSSAPYDFAASNLTKRLAEQGRVFLTDRLAPPPQQVYSLHRKLAGAFLACVKLRATIPCRQVLDEIKQTVYPRL